MAKMQEAVNIYDFEKISTIMKHLNSNHSTELAELVEMNFGPKPESELQLLSTAEVIAIDESGFRLLCNYYRWEMAERNDRMFNEHKDATLRVYTVPFLSQPKSHDELLSIIDKMLNEAKASYLKGFE